MTNWELRFVEMLTQLAYVPFCKFCKFFIALFFKMKFGIFLIALSLIIIIIDASKIKI